MSISPLTTHFPFLFIFEWDHSTRVSPISSFTSSIDHHNWTVSFNWSSGGHSSVLLLNKVKSSLPLSLVFVRLRLSFEMRRIKVSPLSISSTMNKHSIVDLQSARTEWHRTWSLLSRCFEPCSRPTADDRWRRISFHCWLWTSSVHLGLLLSQRQPTVKSRWTSGSIIVTVCWRRSSLMSGRSRPITASPIIVCGFRSFLNLHPIGSLGFKIARRVLFFFSFGVSLDRLLCSSLPIKQQSYLVNSWEHENGH